MDIALLCDFDDDNLDALLGETIGMAILDSGCTRTVCGNMWLNSYLDTLSSGERKSVYSTDSDIRFRFGDGKVFSSSRAVHIPVHVGSTSATLTTQVIDANIPLLLSRDSMKKAGAHLDFTSDNIRLFDQDIPLIISQSGHYCVNLSRSLDSANCPELNHILFSTPIQPDDDHCERKISKLHKQFAHPAPDKLKKLLRDSGIVDESILKSVDDVSAKCTICKRFRKPPLRPVVAFPTATSFNETVAMDIKVIGGVSVLHMVDHATRYSSAFVVPNKKKETIVRAVMEYWVRIFGSPGYFLTDNGGEFVNDLLIEYAEKFNIVLKTTAAESAWSNGLCEKHNDILANMVIKTKEDAGCSMELAVHWAVAAKNSLMNVYGFSPNQLVFGKNPNYPSVHHNRLPAQGMELSSRYLSNNLVALHKARQAFITQESCEKLRRALTKKTRTYSNVVYNNGDIVYYKREKNIDWHGPAKVLGRDGSQYLLKHGGVYVRVHPCRLQPAAAEYDGGTSECLPPEKGNNTTNADVVEETAPLDRKITDKAAPSVLADEDYSSDDDDEPSSCITTMTPPATPVQHHAANDPRAQAIDNPVIPIVPHLEEYEESVEDRDGPTDQNIPHDYKENVSIKEDTLSKNIPRALARLQDFNKRGRLEVIPEEDEEAMEEILFGQSTSSSRYDDAKREELQKWRDMNTFDEVEDHGQSVISTRWVCTEKVKGGKLVTKARLVARGFEEDTTALVTDSPTCQKESLRCLLFILASKQWTLQSIDIKSAYLQGIPINREIYIKPPKCAHTNKLWRLKKCPYGLADAGRHWYLRIVKELKALGGKQLRIDQAVFVWHNSSGDLEGIMVIHVDDFLYGGTETFKSNIIEKVHQAFTVGTEESSGMKYLGLMVSQTRNGIHLSTSGYCHSLKEIDLGDTGTNRDRPLLPTEKTCLKQLSGQINWIATHSRPDCAFDNCTVANSIKEACVQDLYTANKVIRKVKGQEVALLFPTNVDHTACRIVTFTDASFANLPDRGSQGAYVTFLCDKYGSYCLLAWQSRRIRRVVNSTKAAECLAAVEATDASIALSYMLSSMLFSDNECRIPISILSDSKSLVDSVHSSTAVENKRLQIDISLLRDTVQQQQISEFRWVPTSLQVANALTKHGCSTKYLLDIMRLQRRFDFCTGAFV